MCSCGGYVLIRGNVKREAWNIMGDGVGREVKNREGGRGGAPGIITLLLRMAHH